MLSGKLVSNVLAGVVIAVLNITVAISVAAMILVETRGEYLATGVMVLLVGTVVVGLGGTLFSGFRGVVCGARVAFAPVIAVMVGGIYGALGSQAPEQVLPTILAAIMTTSVVTGILLVALGQLKLGSLVRYIPYPVMGGFFAGIGFILIKGGLTVAMGEAPGSETFHEPHLVQLGAPAVVLAVLLYALLVRFDHWLTFPAALLAAFVVFYAVFLATGQDLDGATRDGWLPQVSSSPDSLFPVLSPGDLGAVNWGVIASSSGGILVVALLGAILLLLDTAGIELITRQDLSPDQELKTMGGANIIAGLLGGYPGVHVASDTALTCKLGGDGRVMGLVYAGVVILAILAGTDFVGAVPAFILGGLLVYLGLDFLMQWAWKARALLPTADYLTVLAILGAIAVFGILEGVAFGLALAIVLFVVSYSRLNVVRTTVSGREHASNVDRDLETRERLNEEGERILIVTLQGFIFFGTSEKLLSEIRARIVDQAGETPIEHLVLDFRHVSQLDISAIKAFSKLAQLSDRTGFHVVITGAKAEWIRRLDSIEFFNDSSGRRRRHFEHLDDGVAWCEEALIEELGIDPVGDRKELVDLLSIMTGDESLSVELAPYFAEQHAQQGDKLFDQGDSGDALYIVASGSVAVTMQAGDRQRVLRRYQLGAIVGEMALYTGNPRSASVVIEQDSLLYRLDVGQFESLQEKRPAAAGAFHGYIVRLLSERLGRANRELQYL